MGRIEMTRNAPRRERDQNEAAAYIADLTANLASMARQHGLGTLGYLLEIARMEAEHLSDADDGDSP